MLSFIQLFRFWAFMNFIVSAEPSGCLYHRMEQLSSSGFLQLRKHSDVKSLVECASFCNPHDKCNSFHYDKIAQDCNLINVWATDQILHDESQHFRQNVHVDVKAINESKSLNYKHSPNATLRYAPRFHGKKL
jgi:hypothetical protein